MSAAGRWALEAFPGNTADPKTVRAQITKLQERFGAEQITLVGDRGMLRGPQLQELSEAGLHYITAISKPQIETMLASGLLQMELFDLPLGEVIVPSAVASPPPAVAELALPEKQSAPRLERFILRRNPVRQAEMAAQRAGKKQSLEKSVGGLNTYLAEHPRAQVSTAQRHLEQRLKTLGLSPWMSVHREARTLLLREDPSALEEEAKLDGCYVLRTDLSVAQASKETVHARYKSLGQVRASLPAQQERGAGNAPGARAQGEQHPRASAGGDAGLPALARTGRALGAARSDGAGGARVAEHLLRRGSGRSHPSAAPAAGRRAGAFERGRGHPSDDAARFKEPSSP